MPTESKIELIEKSVNEIKLIDTHEHLQRENNRINMNVDILSIFFLQYASSDLISSGMSYKEYQMILNSTQSLEKRWHMMYS